MSNANATATPEPGAAFFARARAGVAASANTIPNPPPQGRCAAASYTVSYGPDGIDIETKPDAATDATTAVNRLFADGQISEHDRDAARKLITAASKTPPMEKTWRAIWAGISPTRRQTAVNGTNWPPTAIAYGSAWIPSPRWNGCCLAKALWPAAYPTRMPRH